jgi:hypothetical protein
MPDDFAYLLAKALDENRAAMRWKHQLIITYITNQIIY